MVKYCKYCGAEKGKCKDLYVCSKWRIFKSLIKFGFNNDVIGTNDIIDEFYRIKNIIENFYNDFSSNNEMLKKIFNYTSGSANFIKLLKSLDIEIKSINESVSQAWLVGRLSNNNNINNYKCGWHTTWNNKDVYLRSSYEFDFAKELDNNNENIIDKDTYDSFDLFILNIKHYYPDVLKSSLYEDIKLQRYIFAQSEPRIHLERKPSS